MSQTTIGGDVKALYRNYLAAVCLNFMITTIFLDCTRGQVFFSTVFKKLSNQNSNQPNLIENTYFYINFSYFICCWFIFLHLSCHIERCKQVFFSLFSFNLTVVHQSMCSSSEMQSIPTSEMHFCCKRKQMLSFTLITNAIDLYTSTEKRNQFVHKLFFC